MPHVCGDEPKEMQALNVLHSVCPTYVGMNRCDTFLRIGADGMPHVCGDEPHNGDFQIRVYKYAPRMWG